MSFPKTDMELLCADCGLEFILTVGEQEFFLDKGLDNPRRCISCRRIRRQREYGGSAQRKGTSVQERPFSFENEPRTCKDCGESFIFTIGDQEYYQAHGLQNVPKRCPTCLRTARVERKTKIEITCEKCGELAEVPRIILRLKKPKLCSRCHEIEQIEASS